MKNKQREEREGKNRNCPIKWIKSGPWFRTMGNMFHCLGTPCVPHCPTPPCQDLGPMPPHALQRDTGWGESQLGGIETWGGIGPGESPVPCVSMAGLALTCPSSGVMSQHGSQHGGTGCWELLGTSTTPCLLARNHTDLSLYVKHMSV